MAARANSNLFGSIISTPPPCSPLSVQGVPGHPIQPTVSTASICPPRKRQQECPTSDEGVGQFTPGQFPGQFPLPFWVGQLPPDNSPDMLCIHTYTCTHTNMHTYIHACMHACIHTYIHTYIHTHIHTYIHTYTHTHTRTHTHTYIHTYILLQYTY